MECGSEADLAFYPDLSSHHLTQPLTDGQPQARSAIFACCRNVGLAEVLEEARLLFWCYPNAGIADGKMQPMLRRREALGFEPERYMSFLGKLDRVREQIHQDLA